MDATDIEAQQGERILESGRVIDDLFHAVKRAEETAAERKNESPRTQPSPKAERDQPEILEIHTR